MLRLTGLLKDVHTGRAREQVEAALREREEKRECEENVSENVSETGGIEVTSAQAEFSCSSEADIVNANFLQAIAVGIDVTTPHARKLLSRPSVDIGTVILKLSAISDEREAEEALAAAAETDQANQHIAIFEAEEALAAAAAAQETSSTIWPTDDTLWSCLVCTFNNNVNSPNCAMCASPNTAQVQAPPQQQKQSRASKNRPYASALSAIDGSMVVVDPRVDVAAMMQLVSSGVDKVRVDDAIAHWGAEVPAAELDKLALGSQPMEPTSLHLSRIDGAMLLGASGRLFDRVFVVDGQAPISRSIPAPGEQCSYRSDLLIKVAEDAKSGAEDTASLSLSSSNRSERAIWVACAESPAHVIEVTFNF